LDSTPHHSKRHETIASPNNNVIQKLHLVLERIRSWEGRHDILPSPQERGQPRPIIASVIIAIVVTGTTPVHPPPFLLLFLARAHTQGQHPVPVTASPLPITAFLLVRTLPLVLQIKQLQQLGAIAPAHQRHKGGLGIVPLLLVPPPISDSSAGGLNRWWGWGLTLGARATANNDWRPWKWEVDGHGGGIYYDGEVRWGSELGV
jgi:hypothetical protein